MTTTENLPTEAEATDEAVLLMIRKLRRLEPDAFARISGRMPVGAMTTLAEAERRATIRRDTCGALMTWPTPAWMTVEDGEDGEEGDSE